MNEQYVLQLKTELQDKVSRQLQPMLKNLLEVEKVVNRLTGKQFDVTVECDVEDNITNEMGDINDSINRVNNKVVKPKVMPPNTAPVQRFTTKVKGMLKSLKVVKMTMNLKDKASNTLTKVKGKISALSKSKTMVRIKAVAGDVFKKTAKVASAIKGLYKAAKPIAIKVKDMASKGLSKIKGLVAGLAAGVTVVAKVALDGIGQEQTQKITIGRVFENSGQTKAQAKKSTDEYYKYLEQYANKTPFSTQSVAQFGTKAALISGGDMGKAKEITGLMGNVKAFVGDMRTEEEVAEAFFSASTGNLEMLNNMLGTQYKTFEEARAGIAKNQGGLVDEMSKTLPGAISTLQGVVQTGIKDIFAPYSDELTTFITNLTGFVSQSIPYISEAIGTLGSYIQPVVSALSSLFGGIFNDAPTAGGIMQVFGSVVQLVFNMMAAVIRAVTPVIQRIFKFIGKHSNEIKSVIELLKIAWDIAWKAIGKAMELAWKILEPLLSGLLKAINKVKTAIEKMQEAWKKVKDFFNRNPLKPKVEQPDAISRPSVRNNGKKGARHAYGLGRVPKDNYPVRLHQGEKVLTRAEADRYDGGSSKGVLINKLADTIVVREEADIDKIVTEINRKIEIELAGGVA